MESSAGNPKLPKNWNDLSEKQKADWKKKNYSSKIKVSEATIQKLRDGKTKSANVKKYAGTKNKEIREAMNRFYGKGWDKGAKDKTPSPSPSKPSTPSGPKTIRSIEGSQGYSAPKKGSSSKDGNKGNSGKGRQVPVTSVTPKITVKATSKKKQASTREMVLGLASLAGGAGIARAATTGVLKAGQYAMGRGALQQVASKQAVAKAGSTAAKAVKGAKVKGTSRPATRVASKRVVKNVPKRTGPKKPTPPMTRTTQVASKRIIKKRAINNAKKAGM